MEARQPTGVVGQRHLRHRADFLEVPALFCRYFGVMYRLLFGFTLVSSVVAAPLAVDGFGADGKSVRSWPLAGDGGFELQPGASASVQVKVPPLGDKEREAGGSWRGILSVDLYGISGKGTGKLILEAMDPASGEVFAAGSTGISTPAPRAAWVVICSSEQEGAAAAKVFDGDPTTDWHSKYSGAQEKPPHWIGLEFGKPTPMTSVRYTPRQGGFTNGVARKYRLETRVAGADWKTIAAGETVEADARKTLEVKFPEPAAVDAFRFVIESDWSGGGFGTAGELDPVGVKLEAQKPVTASARAWAEIPEDMMKLLEGKSFGLRVRNGPDAGVVVGTPRFARVHTAPSPALFGRSNGGLGPDKLGAGLLGFDALTEHQQTVLTLMEVRPQSAASKAKLKAGDVIVAVAGKPLPLNDLNPGWEWFHQSHEAVIGRETEAALTAGRPSLPLTILRKGAVEVVALPLDRKRPFTTMNPADDPEAARLLGDCLDFLVRTQKDDGSWSGDMIRTCYSALALMATGETKHRQRVKKAVDWAMKKYQKPDDYGNLGFWSGAYAGILYSEWHLATGDKSVLKNLDELRDWAINGQHPSAWKVPALGHGPDGLPYEEKALVAPACHLLVFEALAMRCGMKSGIWELLMPYMEMAWSDPKDGGHGSLGYNRSYKDTGEFWSRSGLFAMAAHLRGQRPDMRDAMTGFMSANHPWIRNSHAYGEPGGSLGLLGLNLAAPAAYQKTIRDYAWWFSLAWEPGHGLRFTTPHMGAPYMGEEDLINATYALVLQSSKKSLQLTGSTRTGQWKNR
jgi:hypothetical protein